MSTCPGYSLEEFLAWNYDLIVDGDTGVNRSLEIAEIMGVNTGRKSVSKEQFAPIVAAFEPYRDMMELRLCDYGEEDHGSWRDYASQVADCAPNETYERGADIVRGFIARETSQG